MGAPVNQGIDLVRLAAEENYVLSQHLYENRLFGADLLFEDGGVPVLPEPHGRDVFEGTERGSSLRLPPGHLGVMGQRGAV